VLKENQKNSPSETLANFIIDFSYKHQIPLNDAILIVLLFFIEW
jgi:hypothetical protein